MKLPIFIVTCILSFVRFATAQVYDWNGDSLPGVKINTVAFRGWIPARGEPLRGSLVLIPGRHQDGRGTAGEDQWQGLATEIGFAIVACQFTNGDPGMYQGDPQGEVARSINTAVEHLAIESKHPELAKAPLALWGVSAGSNVSGRYCSFFPKRVIAFASSTGTCGPGDLAAGKAEIPMLFAVGAKDNPEWVAASLAAIEAGLKIHAPWTLAFNKNAGHGTGKSLAAIIPFLKATVNMRFNPPAVAGGGASAPASIFKSQLPTFSQGTSKPPTAAPLTLHKIDLRAGWLGDAETYDVTSYENFKGNKLKAIWLPDKATATAWQEYLSH